MSAIEHIEKAVVRWVETNPGLPTAVSLNQEMFLKLKMELQGMVDKHPWGPDWNPPVKGPVTLRIAGAELRVYLASSPQPLTLMRDDL